MRINRNRSLQEIGENGNQALAVRTIDLPLDGNVKCIEVCEIVGLVQSCNVCTRIFEQKFCHISVLYVSSVSNCRDLLCRIFLSIVIIFLSIV